MQDDHDDKTRQKAEELGRGKSPLIVRILRNRKFIVFINRQRNEK